MTLKTTIDNRTLLKYTLCCWSIFANINVSAQSHSFNRYHVDLYKGKPAKIILKGNPTATMFRTMIKDTYYSTNTMGKWHGATGLNFAGHYCFAYWGCGSPCQMSAIVDLKTGVVYDGPSGSYGYKFKRNSRLIVVNPDDPHTGCAGCTTEYWIWDDQKKKFQQLH